MKLRLTRRAVRDLTSISDYIRTHNPVAALSVRAALQAAMQMISHYPHAGRGQEHGVRRFALPRLPYLIFYRVNGAADEVSVITIRHGAREPIETSTHQ